MNDDRFEETFARLRELRKQTRVRVTLDGRRFEVFSDGGVFELKYEITNAPNRYRKYSVRNDSWHRTETRVRVTDEQLAERVRHVLDRGFES